MSGTDPLAPVARVARRVPGYPLARRILVPRVRGNAVFRAIAQRLWATEVTPDGRGADLTSGNLLAGVGLHALPVVVFELAAVPETRLEAVVDEIAGIQLLTAGFRPVLLLDRPDFACARKYGFAAELMPPMTEAQQEQVRYWERIRRAYGTGLLLEVSSDGLSRTQRGFLLSLTHES